VRDEGGLWCSSFVGCLCADCCVLLASGWIKKKVGKSQSPQQSPNLSAGRHDDFLSAERAESS